MQAISLHGLQRGVEILLYFFLIEIEIIYQFNAWVGIVQSV